MASRASAAPSRVVQAVMVVQWRRHSGAARALLLANGAEPASISAAADVRMLRAGQMGFGAGWRGSL